MGSTRKITRKETIVSLLAITIAIAFFEILHFHLYETDFIHIPLFYNGDALFSSAIAKTYMETGANYFNPRLGALFGSNLLGYPSLVVSGLLGFHQTVLGLFTQNPFLIMLIRLLAGIFLIAYITYFVFRQMGVDNLYAALGSVAYATCHYVQMRSLGHFSLAMVQYLPLYSKEQFRRHEVRPGITGWAQCHGRNTLSWSEKFKLDVWYVDHCSLMTDIKVIITTIRKVIVRDGISQDGQATMEIFKGNN